VWWVSYRGEGKSGVQNIGVFEDDGSPRKEHPLLLDPAPDAHPLHIARGFALVGGDPLCANDDETLTPCEFRLGHRRRHRGHAQQQWINQRGECCWY
jgi:hypothetical protein